MKHHCNGGFSITRTVSGDNKKSKYKIINFNRGAVERLLLSHQFGVLHSDNIQLAKLEYAPEELRSDAALG